LIDRFLESAIEVDLDLVCDGTDVFIGGVMQHVEEAGVHSGDSACSIPPHSLDDALVKDIEEACSKIAIELGVKGLMNCQIAVKDNEFYILEINPRASRTVPYVSKATNVPLAQVATRVIMGEKLADMDLPSSRKHISWCAVKEAVFPFNRFAGVDPILGPEMKSTGEVMGIDSRFELAYWKSQIAAGQDLPREGAVFLSAKDTDKEWVTDVARKFVAIGFSIAATEGTANTLSAAGIESTVLKKLAENESPNILDLMRDGEVHLLVNTPSGTVARVDEIKIRSEAILRGIPIITTEAGARATADAIAYIREHDWDVQALQDYHQQAPTHA
jgi:carbamoyl-phosphate synthase large subunit